MYDAQIMIDAIVINKEVFLTPEEILELQTIINIAYLNSEKEFWKEGFQRISYEELQKLIQTKHIFVAYAHQTIVGCVKVEKEATNVTFSMLCVKEDFRGARIASKLLDAIEQWAKNHHAKSISLELLKPKHYQHPDKEKLTQWYAKLGYQKVQFANFNEYYPELVPLMKIECVFEVWNKKLY